jgi:hypothetical protein
MNLLENWVFCDGSYRQGGVPELEVPVGWRLRSRGAFGV